MGHTYLFKQITDQNSTPKQQNTHPLGVAAGHLRPLRERGMDAEIASVESGTSV